MNRCKKLLVLILIVVKSSSFAQLTFQGVSTYENYQKQGGDLTVRSLLKDSNENLYAIGEFSGTANFSNVFFDTINLTADLNSAQGAIFFAKYDPTGTLVFVKKIDGTTGSRRVSSCVLDQNGNLYIYGSFSGSTDFDPSITNNIVSVSNSNSFFAKYDPNGNLLFVKWIGGSTGSSSTSKIITLDTNDNIYLTGTFSGTVDFDPNSGTSSIVASASSLDVFVSKYDSTGNYIFSFPISGASSEDVFAAQADNNGIILTGNFSGTVDFDGGLGSLNLTSVGSADIFLASYDSNGTLLFANRMGGVGYDVGKSIFKDASNNIYLSGDFKSTADFDPSAIQYNLISNGDYDAFIAKYTSIGNLVFAKSYGGAYSDNVTKVKLDNNNDILLAGQFNGTVDFNPGVGVNTYSTESNSYANSYLLKLDSNGNYIFLNQIRNSQYEDAPFMYTNDMLLDTNDDIYLTGSFQKSVISFDPPGQNAHELIGAYSAMNSFIVKYSGSGNYLSAFSIGGHPNSTVLDNLVGVEMDRYSNKIVIGAALNGLIDFNPGVGYDFHIGLSSSCLTKFDSLGNFLFSKHFFFTRFKSITTDSAGNIYVAGINHGRTDFNSSLLENSYDKGVFLAKFDPLGDLQFIKHFSIPIGVDWEFSKIKIFRNSIYSIGRLKNGTIDLNPDVAVASFSSSSPSISSGFIAKYDLNGNYQSAGLITNLNYSLNNEPSFLVNEEGKIILAGFFQNTVDFDLGATVNNITAPSYSTYGYIVTYDSLLNLMSAKTIATPPVSTCFVHGLKIKNGIKVLAGFLNGTADFNLGTNVYNVSASSKMFLAKYDSNDSLIFVKTFGGSGLTRINSLFIGEDESILMTGYFQNQIDLDPSFPVVTITSSGAKDIFISKLDSLGNFLYGTSLGGMQDDVGSTILTENGDNILLLGTFSGVVDFDPGSQVYNLQSSFSSNFFMLKMKEDPCYNNLVKIDSVKNVSCNSPGYAYSHTIDFDGPVSYSWDTNPITHDSVVFFNTEGIYTLSVSDTFGCVKYSTILINAPSTNSNYDLVANLNTTNYRVGRQSIIWLDVFNDGCQYVDGEIKLVLDTLLNYIGSSIPPDNIIGDTLIWNFNDAIYDSTHVSPVISVSTPSWAQIGDSVCLKIFVSPLLGDYDTTNNIKEYYFPILNGYDPNDKRVYPQGLCAEGYVENDQLLTYTVRFQNTGNASAINVYVLDTLDPDLNLNTVRVIGNSHSLITEVLPGNVLKFRFDNINLADSTSNEAESHGYVIFEVLPNNGLSNGTAITNNVGIYFDYNPPVYTNTVLNTISDGTVNTNLSTVGNTLTADLSGVNYQWLDCDNGNAIIVGATNQSYAAATNGDYAVIVNDGCFVDTSACVSVFVTSISEAENNNQFSFYPNPSNNTITITVSEPTQIKVINMLGEVVIEKQVQNNSVIDINDLSNGIYFIQTKEGYSAKLIKN